MVGNEDQSTKGKINSRAHTFSQVCLAHFLPRVLMVSLEGGGGEEEKLHFISQLFRSEIKADWGEKKSNTRVTLYTATVPSGVPCK